MAERQKKTQAKSKLDPKYSARRANNRAAVTKHRLKKALELEERRARKEELRLQNAKLEGKVHQILVTKRLLKDLLIEQLRRRGQRLTKQQIELINDDFDDDDIEMENRVEEGYNERSTSEESSGESDCDI